MKVEFYKHNLDQQEIESVTSVLQSTFLTTGPQTAKFEESFATYLGTKRCIGVNSWTMGNFITLKALGIGEGDEVITTPMTFIATPNTILQTGAKPVFVDVEAETGNIDCDKIEDAITERTKAILPIHMYGQLCDMKCLNDIAKKHGLLVVEDAAHAVESERDGIKPGQLSDAAVFSFYATKNLTCGEGGAIVTNNEKLAEDLKLYRLHGMSKSAADRYHGTFQHWDMELLGYKCNMNDIQAAMLNSQLTRLDELNKRRNEIAERYEAAFADMPGVDFPKKLGGSHHARHLFTIWVDPTKRDDILVALQQRQIGVAVNFRALHLLKYYREEHGYERGMFPQAERIGDSTITLPLYPKLTEEEIDYVIDCARDVVTSSPQVSLHATG